jgi:restriction system protein
MGRGVSSRNRDHALEFSELPPITPVVLATAAKPQPPNAASDLHFLFHALALMWPLWALLAVVGAGRVLLYAFKMRRLRLAGIFEIDEMSGAMFEQRLAVLFRGLGYRAEIVGSSGGDFGGDLIVAKDHTKTVVQAKCWKKNVGVKAVQEAVGARGYYSADAAMVVTNARFTKQAQALARKNKVKLWGRDELVEVLLKAQKGKAGRAPVATPIEVVQPPSETSVVSSASSIASAAAAEQPITSLASAAEGFCARCGEPVSAKVRDYCLAHPDRFKGLVYCYTDQRAFKRPI